MGAHGWGLMVEETPGRFRLVSGMHGSWQNRSAREYVEAQARALNAKETPVQAHD